MGKDKKRQLTQLLAFVKDLYEHPDNKEFAAGIRAIVLNDKDFVESVRRDVGEGAPDAIRKIESYLSLDYDIDSRSFPDYALVADETVRERLQADYREMLRFMFGTRNHRIDFPEFCRYATLQVELLVNYYYERKYDSDLERIKQAVVDGNKSVRNGETVYYFKPNEKTKDVADIGLKFKIQALQLQFGWQYTDIGGLLNVTEVRNRQSHRSLRRDPDLIEEIGAKINGPEFKAGGRIDGEKAKASLGAKKVAEYWFQVWLDRQNYDGVISDIARLCAAVAANL